MEFATVKSASVIQDSLTTTAQRKLNVQMNALVEVYVFMDSVIAHHHSEDHLVI